MRKRRIFTISAAAITLGLVFAVPAGAASNSVNAAATSHAATESAQVSCTYTPVKPADRFKGLPTFNPVGAAKPYLVTIFTTQGAITFKALTDKAPCTTNSFRFLAQRDYYDNTHCHRLTTQGIFVLQCGDPTGTGSGGPGYQFPDENLAGATYPAGTVAMANAGPNTNGSQFFIVTADACSWLDGKHTVFGQVTEGMDVVDSLEGVSTDGGDRPTEPVGIETIELSE